MESTREELEQRIAVLTSELERLRAFQVKHGQAVIAPEPFKPIFDKAQETVGEYFRHIDADPSKGTIDIGGVRYLLVRASALSYSFLNTIMDLYADRGDVESLRIGKNLLFDIAHVIGLNDASMFHAAMHLDDPIAKLSAGPVHFAYTGWALVDILPESHPSPDEDYFLTYHHPFSFEADAWMRAGHKTDFAVCIMNAGYSSGWCEESFGIPLTAVEIACKAKGDENCTFVMAPPSRIEDYIKDRVPEVPDGLRRKTTYDIPTFFERKKSEERLQSQNRQFLAILDNFPAMLYVTDPKTYEVLWVNRLCEELIGKNPVGGRCYKEIQNLDGPCEFCTHGIIEKSQGEAYTWEFRYPVFDKDFLITDQIMQWPDGRDVHLAMAIDVTERKRAESERETLREQLSQAEKMEAIGQLAGGVAHDFNNQLAVLMGYGQLLQVHLEGQEELQDYAQKISKVAKSASELTGQLLAFARRGKYRVVPVDLHERIDQVVTLLGRIIDKRIRMRQCLNAKPAMTLGDPTQLENAILNIALNARDAMPEGGEISFETDVVDLSARYCEELPYEIEPGAYIHLAITDTGAGIESDVQKRMFEPFFTTKPEGKGTGMGLAAVYGTVKNHRGAIHVQSELGRGSTFHIYLPSVRSDGMQARAASIDELITGTGHILIIDDEQEILSVASKLLKRLGYETSTCNSGVTAIAHYRRQWQTIDLVLLDMIMPELGGREVYLALREINPEVKVILSSGYSIDGEAQAILSQGVKSFIQKPYQLKELSVLVAQALRRD